jgi:hypothetical protein
MKTFSTRETDIKGSPKRFGNHPNVFFNRGKNGPVTPNLWSMYPCVFCGFNNHCMEKCWKRQSLQKKSSKKEERSKGHFPKKNRGNDKKGLWFQDRNKNLCTHCGMSGHWIEKCWTLHPQLRPKKNQEDVKALTRR